MKLKVGSVEFLNAKPLTYGFNDENSSYFELSFDTPSNLAQRLKVNDIDVGLIPIMEYFQMLYQESDISDSSLNHNATIHF